MKLIRTINPEIKVIDAKLGLVDYIASDETLDHYGEIVRAKGWRFTHFRKNAPFVDSHNYHTIDKLLGHVIDFRIDGDKLIERVKWAIDVEESKLAKLGFRLTESGYLKAVSVGFYPIKYVSKYDSDPRGFAEQLTELKVPKDARVSRVYLEQEQMELSACILGANPSALMKSYHAGVISDEDLEYVERIASDEEQLRQLETISATRGGTPRNQQPAPPASAGPSAAELAQKQRKVQQRAAWLAEFQKLIGR